MYATEKEPAHWKDMDEILLNNFNRTGAEGGSEVAGRADYSVPILVLAGGALARKVDWRQTNGKYIGMTADEVFRETRRRKGWPPLPYFRRDIWLIQVDN